MEIFIELLKKRLEIRRVYIDGIGKPYGLLRFRLPFISLVIFLILLDALNFSSSNLLDLIKQINSLVGIILGFSIASFAIFISITNDKLDKPSHQSKFSFREIGSSLFFYNVEVALFTSLIGIALLYMDISFVHLSEIINIFKTNNFSIALAFSAKAIKLYIF